MTETERIYELDKANLNFEQFIIAVNGALIAYATQKIEGYILTLYLAPLILAIICWILSFYYGINSIQRILSARQIQIAKEREEYAAVQAQKALRDAYNKIGKLANNNSKRMYYLLYIGGILFIVWELLILYVKTYQQ